MRWQAFGERFFNWQSDLDWTWGPFLPLRPPRNEPIRPWVWIRLFVIFTLLGLLLLGIVALACVLLPHIASAQGWPVPAPVAETLATVQAMTGDIQARILFFALLFALPPLFFALCLPYHWAWNRRALRLASRTGPVTEQPGVWPPSPRVI